MGPILGRYEEHRYYKSVQVDDEVMVQLVRPELTAPNWQIVEQSHNEGAVLLQQKRAGCCYRAAFDPKVSMQTADGGRLVAEYGAVVTSDQVKTLNYRLIQGKSKAYAAKAQSRGSIPLLFKRLCSQRSFEPRQRPILLQSQPSNMA